MAATLATRLHAHFAPLHDQPTPDADLLARFALHGDASAFAALVKRHGGMVSAVCRKRLGHAQDAEDAAQAVFLALARKADRVHGTAPVAAWLYGAAVKACREVARRNRRKPWVPLAADVPGDSALSADHEAVAAVLDEVANLSDAHRAAVVLCELEGCPRGLAARRLGIAEGTLSSRLAAARRRLAERLTRRGFAPSALAALAGLAVGSPSFAFDLPSVTPIVQRITEAIVTTSLAWKLKLCTALSVATATVGLALAGGEEPKPVAPPPKPAVAKPAEPKFVFAAPTLITDPGTYDKLKSATVDISSMSPDSKYEQIRTIEISVAAEAIPRRFVNGVETAASADTKFLPAVPTAVSPDGRSVVAYVIDPADVEERKSALYRALVSDTPPPKYHAVLINPTGQVFRLGGFGNTHPTLTWSPDGASLYYTTEVYFASLPLFATRHEFATTKFDVATGTKKSIDIDKRHKVLGVHPDGVQLLVTYDIASFFKDTESFFALVSPSDRPNQPAKSRVIGKPMKPETVSEAVFSPDGKRAIVTGNEFCPVPDWMLPHLPSGVKIRAMQARSRFYLMDIERGTMTLFKTQPACTHGMSNGVQWSPDGSKVAFTDAKVSPAKVPGGAINLDEQSVVVCDPDGSNPVKILMSSEPPPRTNFLHPNHRLIGWR